ncbi:hypothetical protein [Microbaculum marinum]|uniref:Secreted protein n=1 Tax=Microbaculum marinum TaxID=1764581 RepID=A0AAW9RJI3_9HYPH
MTRVSIFAAAAVAMFTANAWGGPIYGPDVTNCKDRNCNAMEIGGTVPGFLASALPWTTQLYAGPGECLRLEVTSQEADLEMRVVSPDGTNTWSSDDSAMAPCPLCPLAAIKTRKTDGWYTVHVGEWGGESVQANFTLAYGRYRRQANPNCTSFVPPADAGEVRKGGESPMPDPETAPGGD